MFSFVIIAGKQLLLVKKDFWLTKPDYTSVWTTFQAFSLGYSATPLQYKIAAPIFFILFLSGIYFSYKKDKTTAISLFGFITIPILIIYIVSITIMPIYLNRQLFIFLPFYILLVATGISSIGKKIFEYPLLFITILFLMLSLMQQDKGLIPRDEIQGKIMGGFYSQFNYKDIVKVIYKNYKDGDVILAPDLQAYMILLNQFINSDKLDKKYMPLYIFSPNKITDFNKSGMGILTELKDKHIQDSPSLFIYNSVLRNGIKTISSSENEHKRFWLLRCRWSKDRPIGKNEEYVHMIFQRYFKLIYYVKTDQVLLGLYENK